MQNKDPAYQKQFKEVEITTRIHVKSGGLEKTQLKNPVQPMLTWNWMQNNGDDDDEE